MPPSARLVAQTQAAQMKSRKKFMVLGTFAATLLSVVSNVAFFANEGTYNTAGSLALGVLLPLSLIFLVLSFVVKELPRMLCEVYALLTLPICAVVDWEWGNTLGLWVVGFLVVQLALAMQLRPFVVGAASLLTFLWIAALGAEDTLCFGLYDLREDPKGVEECRENRLAMVEALGRVVCLVFGITITRHFTSSVASSRNTVVQAGALVTSISRAMATFDLTHAERQLLEYESLSSRNRDTVQLALGFRRLVQSLKAIRPHVPDALWAANARANTGVVEEDVLGLTRGDDRDDDDDDDEGSPTTSSRHLLSEPAATYQHHGSCRKLGPLRRRDILLGNKITAQGDVSVAAVSLFVPRFATPDGGAVIEYTTNAFVDSVHRLALLHGGVIESFSVSDAIVSFNGAVACDTPAARACTFAREIANIQSKIRYVSGDEQAFVACGVSMGEVYCGNASGGAAGQPLVDTIQMDSAAPVPRRLWRVLAGRPVAVAVALAQCSRCLRSKPMVDATTARLAGTRQIRQVENMVFGHISPDPIEVWELDSHQGSDMSTTWYYLKGGRARQGKEYLSGLLASRPHDHVLRGLLDRIRVFESAADADEPYHAVLKERILPKHHPKLLPTVTIPPPPPCLGPAPIPTESFTFTAAHVCTVAIQFPSAEPSEDVDHQSLIESFAVAVRECGGMVQSTWQSTFVAVWIATEGAVDLHCVTRCAEEICRIFSTGVNVGVGVAEGRAKVGGGCIYGQVVLRGIVYASASYVEGMDILADPVFASIDGQQHKWRQLVPRGTVSIPGAGKISFVKGGVVYHHTPRPGKAQCEWYAEALRNADLKEWAEVSRQLLQTLDLHPDDRWAQRLHNAVSKVVDTENDVQAEISPSGIGLVLVTGMGAVHVKDELPEKHKEARRPLATKAKQIASMARRMRDDAETNRLLQIVLMHDYARRQAKRKEEEIDCFVQSSAFVELPITTLLPTPSADCKLRVKRYWTLLRLFVLMYNCLVIPARACFSPESWRADADQLALSLFVIEYCFDLVYYVDIWLHFHHPFSEKGLLVTDKKRIALNYLQTWFLLDLAGCIPWELFLLINNTEALLTKSWIRWNRCLNLVRFGPLMVQVREDFFPNAHPVKAAMLIACGVIMYIVWWTGCAWGFLFIDGWGLGSTQEVSEYLGDPDFESWTLMYKAAVGFHWALRSFVGYGQEWPQRDHQIVFCLVVNYFGVMILAVVIAYVQKLIVVVGSSYNEHLDKMEDIAESFRYWKLHGVGDTDLMADAEDEVRSYYRQLWHQTRQATQTHFDFLYKELPEDLSAALKYYANTKILRVVPALQSSDPAFMIKIVSRMQHRFLSFGDVFFRRGETKSGMYFIFKGKAIASLGTAVMEVLEAGSYWGEVVCIYGGPQMATVELQEYSEVFFLDHETFLLLRRDYPEAVEAFRLTADRRRESCRKVLSPVLEPVPDPTSPTDTALSV